MIVLRCMTGPAAIYTSIHLAVDLFGRTHCFLTGFVFSQVSFVFYFRIIITAFNVYFVIAIKLSFVVDVIFLVHVNGLIVPKIETEKRRFLRETVMLKILRKI